MTRLDMTTRGWRDLVTPVLPHTIADKDYPELGALRIECAEHAIIAVATDRSTLAAERHHLSPGTRLWDIPQPIHIRATDAAASLKLFTCSKDDDPMLRITIDAVAIPIEAAGIPRDVPRLAITLEAPDGTRLVLHDHRDPSQDPLAGWRSTLRHAMGRELTAASASPALSLNAAHLPKWAKAVRGGERLAMFSGAKDGAPLLILVEDHFAGIWPQVSYLEGPEKMLGSSPWWDELDDTAPRLERMDSDDD